MHGMPVEGSPGERIDSSCDTNDLDLQSPNMVGHGPHGMPGEVSSSSVPTLDRNVQPRNKSIELKQDSSTIEGANGSSPPIPTTDELEKILGKKEETCTFLMHKDLQKSKYINLTNF